MNWSLLFRENKKAGEKSEGRKSGWLPVWAFFILHFSFFISYASAQTLSPQAQVSLLTVEPGAELYSSFGHNALRVTDPTYGIDRVYNYGTFDFRTDNFYVKFLRGTLPYILSVADMQRTIYQAMAENRSISEQVLNFTPAQRQRLFEMLETNARPENREYRYKFYYDNCASRPRDMLVRASGDSLRFTSAVDTTRSYRDWMNDYLTNQQWARMGMNLGIGVPADERASSWEAMYLPDNVYTELKNARLKTPGGSEAPAVAADRTLFTAAPVADAGGLLDMLLSPNLVFLVLWIGVFLITRQQLKRSERGFWLDRLLFGFAGVWGWFLTFLWFGTDHGVTAWNPALLFLMPLHLPLIFWITKQQNPSRIRTYFLVTLVLLGLFLLYAIFHHYVYGWSGFLLTLSLRALYQYRFEQLSRNPV